MSILNSFSLEGKTAIVTGCKRGIGKGMAIALAEAGADIIGVSASLELEGSAIEKEVTALGKNSQLINVIFQIEKHYTHL
ncbi:2-deoxy-D-gluconate 3-dehydrogenase [Algibacter lectus]|uniref:2-deoxy-D-gluconate 3-dehydrogenase n=1 Tax=Algibacter lectus TaxID=221126 RepID=A0A090WZ30_9FLAO|nr:2-deoxy-D-gluconate 3-dehydrogenase [Algibacter lectus]